MKLTLDTSTGYLYFIDKTCYLATGKASRVLYHRYVYSTSLGVILTSDDIIHHKDGNKLNNDIANLELLSRSTHANTHCIDRGLILTKEIPCKVCQKLFTQKYTTQSLCSVNCANTYFIKNRSITKELLDELIPTMSWVSLGKLFGYSDNGIKKRAKALGCDIPIRSKRG